jgi:hypothetical protein
MPLDQDTVKEFQENRAETWAASKPWLFLMAIGVIGGLFVGDLNGQSPTERWVLGLIFFVLFGASIMRLTFIVRARYRCPACGKVPMSGWALFGPGSFGYERGVDLNPRQCHNCGTKLK